MALFLILLYLPFLLTFIFILLIFSSRPIFYAQQRVGLNNKYYKIIKLRTMKLGAESNGAKWVTPEDSRATPIG